MSTYLKTHTISLQPIGKRVIAKIETTERVTKGGIILPNSEDSSDFIKAIVVAINPETSTLLSLVPGDVILAEKYAVNKITVNGDEFVIITSDNIAAVYQ